MPFRFTPLKLQGLMLIEPEVIDDARGFFMEVYQSKDFKKAGITKDFVQRNQSRSLKNVLRGLHYQKAPMAQGKLVRVVSGKIFDVAVDIRKDSPTFGRWDGAELDAEGRHMLFIPEGFAHGFCVLSDAADVEYSCTNFHSPEHERGILFSDPKLGIRWPVASPVISERDRKNPILEKADV